MKLNRDSFFYTIGLLVLLAVLFTSCGRVVLPLQSPDALATASASTGTAISEVSESALISETPLTSENAETADSETPAPSETSGASDTILQFTMNDFVVPEGSTVSSDHWLLFLRGALKGAISSYSGAKVFEEAYNFEQLSSSVANEYKIRCNITSTWFSPGSRAEDFNSHRDVMQATFVVHEENNGLSQVDVILDFLDAEPPQAVEAVLKKAYLSWLADWEAAAQKTDAGSYQPVPPVASAVKAVPVGALQHDFAVPASADVSVDLDGDGQAEAVSILFNTDDTKWHLQVGEDLISYWFDAPEGVYLVDLDERDKQKEIAITDHGPSDDETTSLYTYRNGKIIWVGTVSGLLFACDGNGRVSTYARSWIGPMLTWFYGIEYRLNARGLLEMIPTQWYKSDLKLNLLKNMPLYDNPINQKAGKVMVAGTAVVMDVSNISEWFHIVSSDGQEGWFRFQDGENLVLPNGEFLSQIEAFDGIISAD